MQIACYSMKVSRQDCNDNTADTKYNKVYVTASSDLKTARVDEVANHCTRTNAQVKLKYK